MLRLHNVYTFLQYVTSVYNWFNCNKLAVPAKFLSELVSSAHGCYTHGLMNCPWVCFQACGWDCVKWKHPAGKGVNCSLSNWNSLQFWVGITFCKMCHKQILEGSRGVFDKRLIRLNWCFFVSRRLSLSTNCIEKITNLNGLSEPTIHSILLMNKWMNWYFIAIPPLKDVFRTTSSGNLFDIAAQPILEYRWIDSYSQQSLRTQFKVATVYSIHTQSLSWSFRQDWYPMYYPEGMKARVSPVQSIEHHRILAPTRDLNREPLGLQSRVVTTILLLHITSHLLFMKILVLFQNKCSYCMVYIYRLGLILQKTLKSVSFG